MSCKSATFDPDEGRYMCGVTGDGCMYMRPNSKRCAEEWGEGPDSVSAEDLVNNMKVIKASTIEEAVEVIKTEYRTSEVCMGELLDHFEIHGLAIFDTAVVYARLMKFAEDDVLITIKDGEPKIII